MLTKLKILWRKLSLKWLEFNLRCTERDIKDVEEWLDCVTVAEPACLIIDAKEELAELKKHRDSLKWMVANLGVE